MIQSHKHLALGAFWAAFSVLIWSGSLVLLRLGVTTNLNAYDLTAIRFGTAGALLAPVIVKRGVASVGLGVVALVSLIACFGAPYIALISQALKTASASAAGALNPGIMAVSVVLFGIALFKDQANVSRIAGIALIVLGVFGQVAWASTGFTIGHLILAVTGMMWATYTVIIRKSEIAALHATALVAVGSALAYLPIYVFALPKRILHAPLPDILLQAGFQGVLVSVLAVYAFNRSTELLGALIGSTLPALIPLVTLVLGTVFLGEPLRPRELIIALVIGAGVALILIRRHPSSSRSQK